MPYVKQERRPALDEVVNELVKVSLKPRDLEFFLDGLKFKQGKFTSTYLNKSDLKKAIDKAYEHQVKPNGDINYILFKYCKYHVEPSYNNYKAFMGEIYNAMDSSHAYYVVGRNYRDEYREAAEWIRLKILAPYEEEKIKENGDV